MHLDEEQVAHIVEEFDVLGNGAFNYIEFLMVARGVAKELDELKEKAEHSRINSGTFSLSESTGSVYNG